MEPINFKYVTPKTLQTSENGETKNLTVLVLDEKANSKYWKILKSLGQFIEQLGLKEPSEATAWHISEPFAKTDGFQDLYSMPEVSEIMPGNSETEPQLFLYKIPVSLTEHEKEFCVLELKDGKLVENELWK